MENEQITAFLTVVEQGNITKAAEHLYTTQSAISKRINALEKEFHIQLFYRGKGQRTVVLTPAGEQFLFLCRQWQNIKKEADSLHEQKDRKLLSICSIELINSFAFADYYRYLLITHPELHMHVHTHHSNEIYHLVANHYIDLGYVYNHQAHNELLIRPLFQEPMVLVCNEFTGLDAIVRPGELDPEEEIYLKWSSEYELWHDQLWPDHRFRIHVGSSQMIGNFLDQPGRWAIAPASVIEGIRSRYRFTQHTLAAKMPVRTCYEVESRFPRPSRQESMRIFQSELRNYLRDNSTLTLISN